MNRVWRYRWHVLFGVVGCALIVRNFWGLSSSPPGLYVDEASIGYNAWTIAHHGVDEYGTHFPLYFTAFGEYKNPLYIYALAPLTALFSLTPYLERVPAALFGLVTCGALCMTVWTVTRSRGIAMFTLLFAATMPWLTLESRVGFEVSAMVCCLALALLCMSRLRGKHVTWWSAGTGVALAAAIFGYSTARLEVALLAGAFACAYAWPLRPVRRWLPALCLIGFGYAVLFVWSGNHPGALTARFDLISITADHPTFFVVVQRFLSNYIAHFSPQFLLFTGDLNLRHSSGFTGMLSVAMVPFLIGGCVTCLFRFREPLPRFALMGLFIAPVGAALTNQALPHALRSAAMIPFVVVVAAYGVMAAWPLCTRYPILIAATVGVLLVQTVGYTSHLATIYPTLASAEFEAGEVAAIQYAGTARESTHTVFLSTSLDMPYIDALFLLTPAPPPVDQLSTAPPTDLIALHRDELAQLHMREVDVATMASEARTGDLLVLSAFDLQPSHAIEVFHAGTDWDFTRVYEVTER